MMNNTEKLFRYFCLNFNKEETIRQISIETRISYMTLNRIVKKLEKENLIITKKVGNSVLCSLNINNDITKYHLILASDSFRNDFIIKKPLIKKIAGILKDSLDADSSAILFGSYASGKEQKHSDIDIAFISEKEIKKLKEGFRALEQIHSIEINFMQFSKEQYLEMLKSERENVGKQILKNHVILKNPELFWNLVYEAVK